MLYAANMPRLWRDTLAAHRRAVRDATLQTAVALVAEHGLRAVTMSRIAEETGIGRATLYKYFGDVESILIAWHDEQIAGHLAQLTVIRDRGGEPIERVEAVLATYGHMQHDLGAAHGTELVALLHREERIAETRRHLADIVAALLAEAARSGQVRRDVKPDVLASYCLHALAAASELSSRAAVERLVAVTMSGLRTAS